MVKTPKTEVGKAKEDLTETIENLTDDAEKLKAAAEKAKVVEEKNATLEKQKETLEKAKTALETAKKYNADQAIQDGLQDAVTKLEVSVASAKAAAEEAKANFEEVNEAVQEDDDAIAKLTENYNATLGYIENLKEVPAYAETDAPAINEVTQYTLTTAGTNKDNTYQAPAAKAEDKKELPNTGGKDNVAVASLGFLGLFLGALPFVKRKN